MSDITRKTADAVLDKLAKRATQTADEISTKHKKVNVATVAKAFASSVLLSGLLGAFASYANDDPKNDGTGKFISGYSYKYAKQHDMLWSFWANVVMVTVLLPVLIDRFSARGPVLKESQNDLSEYMTELANIRLSGLSLDEMDAFIRNGKNKRDSKRIEITVLEVVKNLSQVDRKYFDDFIANPTRVHSQELAASVMRAHLKTHPEDLEKLYNAFESQHLPPEIRREYENLKKDTEFQQSIFADKIKWLAKDYDDIYDPGYSDMLRVSFMHQFRRGKLADLVSLLSGRDFETKEFREDIVSDSYQKLEHGILNFINEYNFAQFILAIKGAGFISSKLLNSAMTLDFAYTLYLILLDTPEIPNVQIKRYVQKWFVLTTLTSRYIGSPESQMDRDMRSIQEKGFKNFLSEVEASALSDTFWTVTLPQNLETSSVNSPAFNVFLAAQVHLNCNSLLMNGIKVSDLITVAGDIHHIFPRAYLKKNGIDSKTKYNQVANYIYLDTQVNKAISDDAPCDYFSKAFMQCETKAIELGNICNLSQLNENLQENCIPLSVKNMDASSYEEFLTERRKLMASMMKRYYWSL